MCHQSFMDMYGAKQQHMLHHVVWSVSLFNRFIRMLVEKVLFRIELRYRIQFLLLITILNDKIASHDYEYFFVIHNP